MDSLKAFQMATDLANLGADVDIRFTGNEWIVSAFKQGGVTANRVASFASSYSVTAVTENVRFT